MMNSLRRPWVKAALVGGVGGASVYAAWRLTATPSPESPRKTSAATVKSYPPGPPVNSSPPIDAEQLSRRKIHEAEVRANAGHGRPVWCTFGRGVYDITEYVEGHPGGDIILQAAGGALEPYFALYTMHDVPFVYELLEEYRIGDLESSPPIDEEKPVRRKIKEAEVRANAGNGRPVWVTFGRGVYDITEFIEGHPGGDIILHAAGGALEPYFARFTMHDVPFIYELLEEYRIGDLESSPPIDEEKPVRRKIKEAEVRANAGNGRPVWVTFGRGVYDITEFIEGHPGGDIILQAAGGALEPYWALYAQHDVPFVYELLEEYRIGDLENGAVMTTAFDPYVAEPVRSPELLVRSQKPFNAEPEPRTMVETQVTPNELFYVRNHLPVPDVDPETYRLKIIGVNGETIKSLSLAELKTLPKHSVAATLQCAGNRRDEMSSLRPVKGGSWGIAAIGNAVWSGARLTDVVSSAEMAKAQHVCFEGMDHDPTADTSYGASVPIDVIHDVDDVLLAYEMNGEALPRDHGFPVRAVVPGIVGARNVKWLGKVRLSTEESQSHWQRRDYKGFCPAVDWDNVDFDAAPAIQELPVVSAICDTNVNWDKKEVEVRGYAWSGGGRGIIRVDVSADGGENWTEAELRAKEEERRNRVYDWTLWKAVVPVEGERGLEIVCKAVDSTYNTQPEDVGPIWNLRGVLNNAWHRVNVEGKEKS